MPSHKASNTISSGGGGFTFERDVGALYLAAMIAEYTPPGITSGSITQVQFQARNSGALIDDIVVNVNEDGSENKVCIFVRRRISPSSSGEFADFMRDCWEMFSGRTDFAFNPETDKLLLAVSSPSPSWLGDMQEILEIAKKTPTAGLFKTNIESPTVGKSRRGLLDTIKSTLSAAKGSEISDEELWRFLNCFAAEDFDLRDGGKDRVYCTTDLRGVSEGKSQQKAMRLFEVLSSKVAGYAPRGGALTATMLRKQVKGLLAAKTPRKQESGMQVLSPDTEKILNNESYKPLSTARVIRNSLYSVSIVDGQGRPMDSVKYFKHAVKFLEPRDNIYAPFRESRRLAAQFNSTAAETARMIEECIVSRMKILAPHLATNNNYHTTVPNTYSLPSLRYLVWDYCEQGDKSEIKTTARGRFTEIDANGDWVLSQPVSGLVISANHIIKSNPADHPSVDDIISLVIAAGDEGPKVHRFTELRRTMDSLNTQVKIFATNLHDLTEEIDLGIAGSLPTPPIRRIRKTKRRTPAKRDDSEQFDNQLEGLL